MSDDVQSLLQQFYASDRQQAIRASISISQKGAEAVEGLLAILHDKTRKDLWWLAIGALEQIGDPRAVEPIIELLKQPQAPGLVLARKYSGYALARLKDARAIDVLITLMQEKEWAEDEENDDELYLSQEPAHETIEAAIGALASIGEWRGIEAVIERLLVGDTWCDCRMSEWGGERAFQYLVQALQSEDPKRRMNAASLLGDFGDARAIEILKAQIVNEETDEVKKSLQHSLKFHFSVDYP